MLQGTIKHLKDVCRKEDLDVSPNTILEMACKIMISNNIDKSKKENIQSYQKTKINDSKPVSVQNKIIESPTSRQLIALSKMGYTKEEIDKLNKKSAWKIISESKKEY